MNRTLLISVGAVAGANARYWMNVAMVRAVGSAFPWGTLVVNVSGALVLGGFLGFVAARPVHGTGWSLLVAVGFCGAYTTFSTFSYETFALLQQRALLEAASYIAVSLVAGLTAVVAGYWSGMALGRG